MTSFRFILPAIAVALLIPRVAHASDVAAPIVSEMQIPADSYACSAMQQATCWGEAWGAAWEGAKFGFSSGGTALAVAACLDTAGIACVGAAIGVDITLGRFSAFKDAVEGLLDCLHDDQ